jgi:hypothetical protein
MVTLVDNVKRITLEPPALADFPADYWDCFAAPACEAGAHEWARLSLRGAEAAGGVFSRLVWHGVLRFDLEPDAADMTMAGWRITDEAPTRLILDVDGALMAGRLVFDTAGTAATWTTMLRYHHGLAHPVWTLAGHAHRALVPQCMSRALRTLRKWDATIGYTEDI